MKKHRMVKIMNRLGITWDDHRRERDRLPYAPGGARDDHERRMVRLARRILRGEV